MYICIDESGVLNKTNNDFFIISGYICKSIHKVRSIHKELEKNHKIINNIPLKETLEIKGTNSNYKTKSYFLNGFLGIEGLMPFCIVFNLKNTEHLKSLTKNSEKFNFLLKNALDIIFGYQFDSEYKYINEDDEVTILIDEQNISTTKIFEFEEYLKKFSNFCRYWKNLKKVKYLNSKDFREIQVADFFANYFWSIYNYPQTDKVTSLLDKRINNSKKTDISFCSWRNTIRN